MACLMAQFLICQHHDPQQFFAFHVGGPDFQLTTQNINAITKTHMSYFTIFSEIMPHFGSKTSTHN